MFESDDDFIDITKVTGLQPNELPIQKYEPWHKPRKQMIRDKQWWGHLKRLIQKYKKNQRTIKYFGLPGGDLLDIEHLRSCMNNSSINDKELQFHGFIDNEVDKKKADSRVSVLLDYENISADSRVDRFSFDSVKNENSASWESIRRHGPYDFINLDFCNSIFKEDTLIATHKLIDFQLKRLYSSPWLLCLTTRVDPDGINTDLIDKINNLLDNLTEESLLQEISICFSEASNIIRTKGKRNFNEPPEKAYSEVIQISFIVWIISQAFVHESNIELVSSMKYKVHQGNDYPDMCSFVFRFSKEDHTQEDPTGLVTSSCKSKILEESERLLIKIEAIKKLADSLDVDAHLNAHSDENQTYISQTKALLETCGFDVSHYEREVTIDL